MRLLLVEDDRALGQGIRVALGAEGYTLDWLQDGVAALHALRTESFDLLLLDLGLPRLDGLDLLQQLRAEQHDLPVLILTARDGTAERIAGLDAGADDYLVKPVDYDLLLATVATRLALVQRLQRQHQHQLQRSLLEVHDHWHGVLDNLGHCALVCDGALHIYFANRAAHALGLGLACGPSPLLQNAAGQLVLQPALALHAGVQAFLASDAETACIEVPAQASGPLHWRL